MAPPAPKQTSGENTMNELNDLEVASVDGGILAYDIGHSVGAWLRTEAVGLFCAIVNSAYK